MTAQPNEAPPPPLPPLRQELSISRNPAKNRWLIQDPVRGRFHATGETAFLILTRWACLPPDELVGLLRETDVEITREDLDVLCEFLIAEKLLDLGAASDTERLATHQAAMRKPWHEQLIHKYLFFKIPLWNPTRFLDSFGPRVSACLRPRTFWIIAALGAVGLYFAARQWDDFVSTFLYFFTLQGFIFYALTLCIIKIFHELGHGFAARHFGARVPVIGLAFLVMFPILYTDTTDAWRISDRRARLLISAAGMIVELSIAALSLLAWAFLPDGVWRSAAFFAATTSWTLSLFVNLNPWMRFDGYYLLSDAIGIENLQARGFAVGRWVMRKTLWGLDEGAPETFSRRCIVGLCTYAWSTWIYRFFLFLGIAILVHHIFPKAIGIVLFVIEIGIFIVVPIWREIKHWWSQHMTIISNPRGRLNLLLCGCGLTFFLTPWQTSVRAPAVLRPAQQVQIFAPEPARITDVFVQNGAIVKRGDVLLQLASPALIHRREIAELEVEIAEARLAQQAASLQDRQLRSLSEDTLATKREALAAITRQIEQLTLRAPQNGKVGDLPDHLVPGHLLRTSQPVLRLVAAETVEMTALPRESDAARLQTGAKFKFIADEAGQPRQRGTITERAPTAEIHITEPILSVIGGGPIAVAEDIEGRAVADIAVFRVKGTLDGQALQREQRGVAHIAAKPRSPAQALWTRAAGILLRETDF
jgi:putative peptide zinc metalloprotease protein